MEHSKGKSHSHHFSHEHSLEHTNSPPKPNTSCFGCKGNIFPGNDFYECKTCKYSLHRVCHDMPKKVEHPSDPNHSFILKATPKSTKTPTYDCNACGHHITGFYYTCANCENYYHILCLIVPLSVKISSHIHSVTLEFSPPYDFECDLCKEPSFSGWLYRCGSCEFDAHITCAIKCKGEEWIERGSFTRDKGHELMELIAQGMNGSDHLQYREYHNNDQLSPSHQFGDALFSIDFAKSLLRDEYIGHENKGGIKQLDIEDLEDNYKTIVDSRNRREPKHIPKGVANDVWSEIGRESHNRKGNYAYKDRKDETEKRRSDDTKILETSSCLSSLYICLCCERK